MSEIRDEVLIDLLSIKGMTAVILNAVITHPHIAVVDKDVEKPDNPYPCDSPFHTLSHFACNEGFELMVNAGFRYKIIED